MSLPSNVNRKLFTWFSEGLPAQTNCSAFTDDWPKSGICSSNAVDCVVPASSPDDPSTFTCVCASGWTGKSDFISGEGQDCHINEQLSHISLVIYLISGIITAVFVLFMCRYNFKGLITDFKKGDPLKTKDLSYFSFFLEAIWSVVGLIHRIKTKQRYAFDVVPTLFMSVSIVWFILSAALFLKTWIRMATAQMGSKADSRRKANRITNVMFSQLAVVLTVQFVAFNTTPHLKHELDPMREILMILVNLGTVLGAISSVWCLYCMGSQLVATIKEAGRDDEKLKRIGNDMLTLVYGCIIVVSTIVVGLIALTSFPILLGYQIYVMPLNFATAHVIPILGVWLFEKGKLKKEMAAARRSSVRRLSSMGLMSAKSSSQVAPDKRRGSAFGLAQSTLVSKMSTNSTSSRISSVEEPDDTPPLIDGTQLGSPESSGVGHVADP